MRSIVDHRASVCVVSGVAIQEDAAGFVWRPAAREFEPIFQRSLSFEGVPISKVPVEIDRVSAISNPGDFLVRKCPFEIGGLRRLPSGRQMHSGFVLERGGDQKVLFGDFPYINITPVQNIISGRLTRVFYSPNDEGLIGSGWLRRVKLGGTKDAGTIRKTYARSCRSAVFRVSRH